VRITGNNRFIGVRINNGTKIGTTLCPLTFILSPVIGGEGRVRGRNNMNNVPLLLRSSIIWEGEKKNGG
jgi:hypothetical protein